MAIVIQEKKTKINWFGLGIVFLITATVFILLYYLFFINPPLIEKVAPPKLQSIKELSDIKLDPDAIINNPRFQNLKMYVGQVEIEIGQIGKVNPFMK